MVQLSVILRTRYREVYHWKRKWKMFVEKQRLSGPIVPKAYMENNVQIINAATEQTEHEAQIEGWFDWKPDHPQFKPAPGNGPENPRYKDIPCRLFRRGTSLPEGLEQAQILTKTVVNHGIPPLWEQAEKHVEPLRLADECERVRRYVMQSVRWDPSDLQLPKRTALYWGHKYPYYYGITLEKANDIICQNLFRLVDLTFAGRPEILKRHLVKNALVNVGYEPAVPTDSRVVLNCNNNLMLTGDQPLQPFFNSAQVAMTKDIVLPSVYPLKPTLNLDEASVYDWDTMYPFDVACGFAMPHTIVVQHNEPKEWTFAQKQATALMHCHATLAALARKLFSAGVGILPHPLSIQCILADRGKHFTFYAYQLNTLDVTSKEGIKNQIWIDSDATSSVLVNDEIVITRKPYTLFSLADQMEGLMGYQMYREKNSVPRYPIRTLNSYNPVVMKKLLTLYATQLPLDQHQPKVVDSPPSVNRAAAM